MSLYEEERNKAAIRLFVFITFCTSCQALATTSAACM